MYSTMRLIFNLYSTVTFNALFNIQIPIQHSTIHLSHLSLQQFQLFIQHSTIVFKMFNYSFKIQL